MFIRKSLLVVVLLGGMLLAAGMLSAAYGPAALAAATAEGWRLGSEMEISTLDTLDYLPSVAYNWKHHEYLVVWHTNWIISSRDIRAARISDAGKVLDTFLVYEDPTRDSAQPAVDYDPVHDATW